ncbi:MAG: hypothetical protein KatS3mg102_2722 [Planctomycetota bacterium]|nr:MAG: hypothetical protein KatS3mg102_2722 [Planctomycetota bacterium]
MIVWRVLGVALAIAAAIVLLEHGAAILPRAPRLVLVGLLGAVAYFVAARLGTRRRARTGPRMAAPGGPAGAASPAASGAGVGEERVGERCAGQPVGQRRQLPPLGWHNGGAAAGHAAAASWW